MEFNKERFVVRLVGVILLSQLALYGIGTVVCSWRFASSSSDAPICRPLREGLDGAVATALNVLLALLGAGAVAAEAISTNHRNQRKREEEFVELPEAPEPVREIAPEPPQDADPRF